jgi:catechol 2,3-dioxygenase-like lactoylglutathione lyase family enzyme
MKIGHIEIFVTDPPKAKDFYHDVLGFEEVEIQHEKFVWMKKDKFTILLRPGKKKDAAPDYQSARQGIVIYTDNLEKAEEELKAKGLKFKGTDGSKKCLTFTDPDGNWFQLVNPEE